MAEFDPFEREFRRQAADLRRTPSRRAWNRVERRLDRRSSPGTLLGIRPWMIAALFLLVAGTFVLAEVVADKDNVLAQRSQSLEELTAPYTPEEPFVPGEYQPTPEAASETLQDADFRDVIVAEKHRVRS